MKMNIVPQKLKNKKIKETQLAFTIFDDNV